MKKTNKKILEEIIRVDHAGERGAIKIYEGQLLALKTLKKDKILFKLWKEVSPNYAIDNIFEKLWQYICSKFFKKYNIKNYFLRKKVTFSEISIFLSEFSTYSAIIDEIKERENRPVIIHFPNFMTY